MKIFITGGTGFIGSHLADRLLKNGFNDIHCLIRSDDKWLKDKPVKQIKGNLHDIPALQSGMEHAETVFHIAGLVKASTQAVFDRANVEATENVLRMALKLKIPKLVILSSLAACGPSFKRPLTEDDPRRPITRYGISKKRMEEMVERTVNNDISVTIIRPPAVYGPREEQIFTVFQLASFRIFPIIGDGSSTRVSLVHVDDLVKGILLAAEQKKPGVNTFFISSEKLYTWNEIHLVTEKVLNKKIFPIKFKPRFVQQFGTLMENAASFIGRYPVINRDKAKELGVPWACSVDKAKRELGFIQETNLMDGLSQTIQWYKKHHWL